MCDYCDCRRIPEIARLGQEHETIQELADEAMRLAKAGAAELPAAIARLREALAPHAAREENGVFTQARIVGLGPEYVDDLEEDHERFVRLLDGPEALDPESLEALLDDLHRHIAIEEYDLFPAAAQLLGDAQWRLVGSV